LVQQKVRQNRIKVSKQIDKNAEGMSIRCFPNKFEQVVMNLLSNACDAMSSCDKRELSVLARCEGEIVFIDVRDTGTGIPKELQEKIFENFFTTKPKGEGTGLGLSIVRNIVREHGGDLILSSEPGTGTTFTIRLPISKSEEEGESASGSAHPTAAA
jgi:two-component system NtrC family sensor kinase